jgi:hypothetical protein
MKVEIVFEDHTREMVPKRYLYRFSNGDKQAYIWANSGTTIDIDKVVLEKDAPMPQLPHADPGIIYPWRP